MKLPEDTSFLLSRNDGQANDGCPFILTFFPDGEEGIYWRCPAWKMKATKFLPNIIVLRCFEKFLPHCKPSNTHT
jgi:hypothetical protein